MGCRPDSTIRKGHSSPANHRASGFLRNDGLMASLGTWLNFVTRTNILFRFCGWGLDFVLKSLSPQLSDFVGMLIARPRGGIALSMLLNWACIIHEKRFGDGSINFDITRISIPVHMIVAEYDWLSNENHLKTMQHPKICHLNFSGHVDFVLDTASEQLKKKLLAILSHHPEGCDMAYLKQCSEAAVGTWNVGIEETCLTSVAEILFGLRVEKNISQEKLRVVVDKSAPTEINDCSISGNA